MLRSDRVLRVRSNCVALRQSGRQQRESPGYIPQYELTGAAVAGGAKNIDNPCRRDDLRLQSLR